MTTQVEQAGPALRFGRARRAISRSSSPVAALRSGNAQPASRVSRHMKGQSTAASGRVIASLMPEGSSLAFRAMRVQSYLEVGV
jgi:hypothetical protein